MKNTILAAALAFAGVSFAAPASDAASIIITDSGHVHMRPRHFIPPPPPPPHFRKHYVKVRPVQVCTTKYVQKVVNHRMISKKITTCR